MDVLEHDGADHAPGFPTQVSDDFGVAVDAKDVLDIGLPVPRRQAQSVGLNVPRGDVHDFAMMTGGRTGGGASANR
ncbi:MAG TPA: hypothetical protein VMU33_17595 [Burkholderiaceae bacterium]|nr:hypothetical protein [Burkholderiaceae bacterium]